MYNQLGTAAGGAAVGTLPFTGPAISPIWIGLAGFALIAAGIALWRLFPRKEK